MNDARVVSDEIARTIAQLISARDSNPETIDRFFRSLDDIANANPLGNGPEGEAPPPNGSALLSR